MLETYLKIYNKKIDSKKATVWRNSLEYILGFSSLMFLKFSSSWSHLIDLY